MKIPVEGSIWLQQAAAEKLKGNSTKDLKAACEGFEAYLLSSMLNQLQKTVSSSEKGFAEQTYFSMLNQRVAEVAAKRGIGIKDMLMRYVGRTHSTKVLGGPADNTLKEK